MPAPSPESSSAEQAPRCSIHPKDVSACKSVNLFLALEQLESNTL